MPGGESRARESRDWDSQKRSRQERLQAGSKFARGKMVEPADTTALLEAIIRPGDRLRGQRHIDQHVGSVERDLLQRRLPPPRRLSVGRRPEIGVHRDPRLPVRALVGQPHPPGRITDRVTEPVDPACTRPRRIQPVDRERDRRRRFRPTRARKVTGIALATGACCSGDGVDGAHPLTVTARPSHDHRGASAPRAGRLRHRQDPGPVADAANIVFWCRWRR